jgi:hypothetical protein
MFTTLFNKARAISFSSKKYIYIGGCVTYTIFNTYNDSKKCLTHFKNNTLWGKLFVPQYEIIKTEWAAAKYGADENLVKHGVKSILWPVLLPIHMMKFIIPSVVLTFNPPPKTT